ncbi:putative the AROM polypeptide catalyzes 5 consecutive enzymatic reactions in prechorismate polyaromatic amino acid biosynthesis [Lyophyllum shimeji]|uniref:The AROM polypeptide catalyzes 5 consecutive enzymatic reactions in prechorismate polyaromatic amino acid biosynthesis n=1 Tax=Lyophyllum shimeji TaxID=47721 RepID=A0A9P3PPD9_LYOSH|nr:putative the AROM polypeptide catalyzes 5 consecutive enzymatic reactions in prechorismate polyaromatic amino acid biosynthesis [Lyophyllum shimeji]
MTTLTTPPRRKKFYLFGYPIAHSAAPALHNLCFANWLTEDVSPNTFELWSTSKVTDTMVEALSGDDFGGSAVTMPLKAEILSYLDDVSPESRATGACNTVVKVSTGTGHKLVGQNTDILGIRNALLRALRSQFPGIHISSEASYSPSSGSGGVVIGGGATTRSAVHALTLLGLSPLYLVNRDVTEVRAVQDSFPHLDIIHLKNPDDVEAHLAQQDSPRILMIVGAIPALAPVTSDERRVYSTVSTILTISYTKPAASSGLPIPKKRIFLEMAYKPRLTPMLQVAMAHGWHAVDGIQAMIEQGLAQQRMWYMSSSSLQVGSDPHIFSAELEKSVRELCEGMGDVVVDGEEVDRATGKESAVMPTCISTQFLGSDSGSR